MITRAQIYRCLGWIVFIAILGIVGKMDERDEKLERDHYCKIVDQKVWPDYRHIENTECMSDEMDGAAAPAD